MNTSADAPFLDCAYKLEEYEGQPRRKRSEGKATWPGRKQVHRRYDGSGLLAGDVLTLVDDAVTSAPLLEPVMRGGRPLTPRPSLAMARERLKKELACLPEPLCSLQESAAYAVEVAPSLRALASRLDARD